MEKYSLGKYSVKNTILKNIVLKNTVWCASCNFRNHGSYQQMTVLHTKFKLHPKMLRVIHSLAKKFQRNLSPHFFEWPTNGRAFI